MLYVYRIRFQKEQEQLNVKLLTAQTASENLLSEHAKLQVQITTLQSQNNSLAAQHTALQLANSQLVAEKEEVRKKFLLSLPIFLNLFNTRKKMFTVKPNLHPFVPIIHLLL